MISCLTFLHFSAVSDPTARELLLGELSILQTAFKSVNLNGFREQEDEDDEGEDADQLAERQAVLAIPATHPVYILLTAVWPCLEAALRDWAGDVAIVQLCCAVLISCTRNLLDMMLPYLEPFVR